MTSAHAKFCTRLPNNAVAEEAVRAIGKAASRHTSIANSGLSILMRLLRSPRGTSDSMLHGRLCSLAHDSDNLVAEAVIALKSVILALPSSPSGSVNAPEPTRLVARLARQLSGIPNPRARASVFWLIGQYAATDKPASMGLGWDGVHSWVPDVLRAAVKGFAAEVCHIPKAC